MIEAAAIEFYVNDKGAEYNKHDKGYKSLLYSKKRFLELLRSFVKHGCRKIHENSIVRGIRNTYFKISKKKET